MKQSLPIILSLLSFWISKTEAQTMINYALSQERCPRIIAKNCKIYLYKKTFDSISIAYYPPLYYGQIDTSIFINCAPVSPIDSFLKKNKSMNFFGEHLLIQNENLEILVDTSQILNAYSTTPLYLTELDIKNGLKFSEIYYSAYPIIIKNKGKKPAVIGQNYNYEKLLLLLEAQDSLGNWRPIEQADDSPNCMFGTLPVILPPNEIIISIVVKQIGTYRTKLRLKLGKHYSNEFFGNINPTQFKD